MLVAEHDLPLAKNTLAKLREESSQIDWSAVDIGEPDEADPEPSRAVFNL